MIAVERGGKNDSDNEDREQSMNRFNEWNKKEQVAREQENENRRTEERQAATRLI